MVLPSISFTAFVFWLLAVPMDGPLTAAAGIGEATRWFLLPHAATLALIGWNCPARRFSRLAPYGLGLTVLITLLLPLLPQAAPWLLTAMGLVAAPVTIEAGRQLHTSRRPVLSAALGLVAANLLLLLLHLSPGGDPGRFALAALPLLLLGFSIRQPVAVSVPSTARLMHYLPFVLVFHVVSGLMYSAIYPAYHSVALLPGAELPFYMITVIGAVWLVRKNRELALVFGIVLGMAAFALLQQSRPLQVNLSMFAMQAGQGFVDLFLLAFLLSLARPVRAFGIGLATLCLGIYGGQMIGRHLQDLVGLIAMTGHVVLNLSVLILYFLGRRQDLAEPAVPTDSVSPTAALVQPGTSEVHVPENLRLLLSEREHLVLVRSLDGRSYRDIATELRISESSVKTYMKRICDKFDAPGRKGLFEVLACRQAGNGPS